MYASSPQPIMKARTECNGKTAQQYGIITLPMYVLPTYRIVSQIFGSLLWAKLRLGTLPTKYATHV